MSYRRSPFGLLIIISLLISATAGMLHGRKKGPIKPNSAREIALSIDDTIDLIDPLLLSRSFDAVSQALEQIDESVILATIERIIKDQKHYLNKQERAQLLLNIIANLQKKTVQKQLLKLLQNQFSDQPVYSYALFEKVPDAIKTVRKWIETADAEQARIWSKKSLHYAIQRNDPEMLDKLYASTIRSTPEFATSLLEEVVSEGHDIRFVPLLVRTMQANPDFSADGKRTLLIKAVEQQNESMVRALLEAGADSEKMVNEQVGTPHQIAFEKGYVAIEAILDKEKNKKK